MTHRDSLAHATGMDVSRETSEELEAFAALLTKWSSAINLIASGTVPDLWQRHIIDSAQLWPLCIATKATTWADLGSGGGLPGIVLGILAKRTNPDIGITLAESDQRKAAFLRTAIRELDLPMSVQSSRVEDTPPLGAELITARAFAPLSRLLDLASPHLVPDGRLVLLKGRNAEAEISAARRNWHFDLSKFPSITDPEASILILERITRV